MSSSGTLEGLLATYRADPEFIAESLAIEVLEQAVAIMRERDINRAELGRRLGTSRAAVSHLFNKGGHNMTLLTLARLATALGTELRCGLGDPVSVSAAHSREAWEKATHGSLSAPFPKMIATYAEAAKTKELAAAA